MQAQTTEVKTITSTQSLAAVQTLLKAGLGCITYLRDLLPSDNFTPSHFTSEAGSISCESSDASSSSADKKLKRNVNGFKIMTMTRGFTDEADKLLNYLEYGLFDALQKQYLRSFIFAIYLDNKDPNNIVEAYTFNFHYHAIPGSDTTIPVMSLGDGLKKLSLSEVGRKGADPVVEAALKGKAPTLRDVKMSVKALLKSLVQATTHMDNLPKRRFATFKVFYTDDTPSDYEPPYFHAGDQEKDKWFFMTHDMDEIPDNVRLGQVETGHHSVNVNVRSVTSYLPSSTEDDEATFTGTTFRTAAPPSLTPVQEAALRLQQAEKQLKDAEERNIAWAVEDGVDPADDPDVDADSIDDTDYVKRPDGVYERVYHNSCVDTMVPVGVRNAAGDIEPMSNEPGNRGGMSDGIDMDIDEAHFSGVSEPVPSRVGELNSKQVVDNLNFDQTQPIEIVPPSILTPRPHDPSYFTRIEDPPYPNTSRSELLPPSFSPASGVSPSQESDIDTQILKNIMLNDLSGLDDTEMLDMETQANHPEPIEETQSLETIESFGPNVELNEVEGISTTPKPAQKKQGTDADAVEVIDNGLECECGVSIEDECCFCEGGCGRWYHLWCMGYHSIADERMPSRFVCFDCRVRGDSGWDLIKLELYPKMLTKFKELALFRRAIKIAESDSPGTATEFAKAIGCDNVLARQLFKRLETEGFITAQITTIDDLGFSETRSRSVRSKGKSKGKQLKHRRNMQKPKFVFNRQSIKGIKYLDYFNPDHAVERRMLCLPELDEAYKPSSRLRPVHTQDSMYDIIPPAPPRSPPILRQDESQTQEETQITFFPPPPGAIDRNDNLKRTIPDSDTLRPTKKIKISVAQAVDLAD